eukprot:scaffold7243_cov394-Prasinococcus_capsulatus_cf.AAC.11
MHVSVRGCQHHILLVESTDQQRQNRCPGPGGWKSLALGLRCVEAEPPLRSLLVCWMLCPHSLSSSLVVRSTRLSASTCVCSVPAPTGRLQAGIGEAATAARAAAAWRAASSALAEGHRALMVTLRCLPECWLSSRRSSACGGPAV